MAMDYKSGKKCYKNNESVRALSQGGLMKDKSLPNIKGNWEFGGTAKSGMTGKSTPGNK
jgi:hypothetical protein